MDTLILEGTEDTPKVVLDKASNTFSISGRSLPEDVTTFYKPVLDWLEHFSQNPLPSMEMEIKLEYFNTASSKILLDILMKLEEIHQGGGSAIKVKWTYDAKDSDMLEAGEEYKDLVELDFEMIGY